MSCCIRVRVNENESKMFLCFFHSLRFVIVPCFETLPVRCTAMASLERNNADAALASKACIVCNAYQPRNGKFLSCFHVICAGCLAESMSRDGSVSCLLCKSDTSAKVTGVDLGRQLISSAPILNGGDPDNKIGDTSAESMTPITVSGFCDPCLDMDVERNASHQCDDCADLPLCEMHAAKHPKKRASSGHRVRAHDGRTSSSQDRPSTVSKHCMYHAHCVVVTYCQTCRQCVCAECIAAGSHDGHPVESLASAGDKQRARVVEVFYASGLGDQVSTPATNDRNSAAAISTVATAITSTRTTHTSACDKVRSAEDLLEVVQQDIAMMTEEASTASKIAAERFDKIEEMLKCQREQVLQDIDQRLWTQLDPLETKKTRLESLIHRRNTVVDVVTRLTSPTICPEVLLNAAERVVENTLAVSKDLKDEQEVSPPASIFVISEPLDGIHKHLQEAVQVHNGDRVSRPGIFFDQEKCNRRIVLSDSNRVATLDYMTSGKATGACVLATESFTSGRHEWSCRVVKGIVEKDGVCIGVTSSPSDGNYNNNRCFFGGKSTGHGYWNAHGNAFRWQRQHPFEVYFPSADMVEVHDGDILTLTLDFDTRTLSCINQRTKQSKRITGIECKQPLYPAVSFGKQGESVEILQHSSES